MEIRNSQLSAFDLITEVEKREGVRYTIDELKELITLNSYDWDEEKSYLDEKMTYFVSSDGVLVPSHVTVEKLNKVFKKVKPFILEFFPFHSKKYDEMAKYILDHVKDLHQSDYELNIKMIDIGGGEKVAFYLTDSGNLINLKVAAAQIDGYEKRYDMLCINALKEPSTTNSQYPLMDL